MKTSLEELLHKRILVVQKEQRGYNSVQTVEELKILEISTTGNFIKIQNMNGNKFWKHSVDIVPIEVLSSLETKPSNQIITQEEEHKKRHLLLHKELDELVADFISCTDKLPSTSTLMDLMTWSFEQTKNPTEINQNK